MKKIITNDKCICKGKLATLDVFKFVVLYPPRLLFQTKSKTVRTRNFSVLWSATDIFSLSIIFVIHNNCPPPSPLPKNPPQAIFMWRSVHWYMWASLQYYIILPHRLISPLYKSSTAFSASALVSTASRIVLYFISCNNPNSGHYFTRLIDSYGLILEILLLP